MIRELLALGVCGSFGLAACADAPDGSAQTSQTGQEVPISEVPARFAAVFCAFTERCLGEVFLAQAFQGESCESQVSKEFEQSDFVLLEAGVDEGRLSYHPERLALCEEAFAEQGCESTLPGDDICRSVFEGSVARGGACETDAECAGEAICASQDSCPGTCTEKANENGACSADADCAGGLRCGFTPEGGPNRVCRRPAQEGEPCEGADATPCAGFLYCDLDDSRVLAGTCRQLSTLPKAELGQSCDQDLASLCGSGLVCSVDSVLGEDLAMTCKPAQGVAGGPCTLAVPTDCPDGEYCPLTLEDYRNGTTQANCLPLPVAGESCATGPKDGVCGSGLRCDAGVCVPRKSLGEPCAVADLCYSGQCVDGVCAATAFCG